MPIYYLFVHGRYKDLPQSFTRQAIPLFAKRLTISTHINIIFHFRDGVWINMVTKVITICVLFLFLMPIIHDEGVGQTVNTSVVSGLQESWNVTLGGSEDDWAYFIQPTDDDGYILLGLTRSIGQGSDDIWLVKIDADGNELWNSTFGGEGGERGYSVQQTSDGGYILTGYTNSYGAGAYDAWILKTSSSGVEEWNSTLGGSRMDWGYSILEAGDGYIVAGYTRSFGSEGSDIWILQIDDTGKELWNKTFGGEDNDVTYAITQANDNGYILVGGTHSFGAGDSDVWVVKIDSKGNKVWDHTFGGPEWDEGYNIQQTDGGYVIAGATASSTTASSDAWLIKIDEQGREIWSTVVGGEEEEIAFSVYPASTGGYIVTGYTDSFSHGRSDVWLLRIDESGNVEWHRNVGGNQRDRGFSVLQAPDGGYVFAGLTASFGAGARDMWAVKMGEPPLSIEISGGVGFSVTITNNGEETLTDLSWTTIVNGMVFIGETNKGKISGLSPGEKTTQRLLCIGFGPAIITAGARAIHTTTQCFIIGPVVILAE